MKMKLKNNDMREYFELYKILEDGEVEHIDQICINDKNIFQTIYDNFKELRNYVNNDYFVNIYDIELKKYLINTFLNFNVNFFAGPNLFLYFLLKFLVNLK